MMSSSILTQLNKAGSCLYYSCLFLTAEQKNNLEPLLSFIWRTERIPRFSLEAEVVTTQLSWWQKEIALAYNQQATHPLVIELIRRIENHAEKVHKADFVQNNINTLVASLTYMLSQQQDCQNDDRSSFEKHAQNKRKKMLTLAADLIDAEPIDQSILDIACEILTSIDIVDGFHRDAVAGIISLPLDSLIEQKITVDELINPASKSHQFWELWLKRNLVIYNKLWQCQHPLIEVILIYSGLRLLAFKKSLNNKSSEKNNCYNSRPTLSTLQKFWLSWKIRSRWNSGKKPLRNLIP